MCDKYGISSFETNKVENDGYNVSDEILMALDGCDHFSMAKSLGILTSFVDTIKEVNAGSF